MIRHSKLEFMNAWELKSGPLTDIHYIN